MKQLNYVAVALIISTPLYSQSILGGGGYYAPGATSANPSSLTNIPAGPIEAPGAVTPGIGSTLNGAVPVGNSATFVGGGSTLVGGVTPASGTALNGAVPPVGGIGVGNNVGFGNFDAGVYDSGLYGTGPYNYNSGVYDAGLYDDGIYDAGLGTGVGTGFGVGVGTGFGTGFGPGVGTGVGTGFGTGVGTGVGVGVDPVAPAVPGAGGVNIQPPITHPSPGVLNNFDSSPGAGSATGFR